MQRAKIYIICILLSLDYFLAAVSDQTRHGLPTVSCTKSSRLMKRENSYFLELKLKIRVKKFTTREFDRLTLHRIKCWRCVVPVFLIFLNQIVDKRLYMFFSQS